MSLSYKAIRTVREPKNGDHELSELNDLFANGWRPNACISDCQSAVIYILERGEADKPEGGQ